MTRPILGYKGRAEACRTGNQLSKAAFDPALLADHYVLFDVEVGEKTFVLKGPLNAEPGNLIGA